MITLYGHPVSGNAHRVLNFLHILDLPFENTIVDLPSGEHKNADFLRLNPLGQVPVLTDNELVLRDSTAILMYLARKYDASGQWLPEDASVQAQVQQWLSIAVHEVITGPFLVRVKKLFNAPDGLVEAKQKTEKLFSDLFVPHLERNDWLVGEKPTIADIACYSYIARVTDGDFSLEPYPAIQQWLARIESIKGFAPMPTAIELGFE